MKNLKATINEHMTTGRVKAAHEYLKEMNYSRWEIECVATRIASCHKISTSKTIEIDLTLYECYGEFETVVHIIGKGSDNEKRIPDAFGFYEMYFTYEKGMEDVDAIVKFYAPTYESRIRKIEVESMCS